MFDFLKRIRASVLYGIGIAVSIVAAIAIAITYAFIPFGTIPQWYEIVRAVAIAILVLMAMFLTYFGLTSSED